MKILVAGAAGFLGSHLSNRLLCEGHQVTGVDSNVTGDQDNVDWLARHPEFTFSRQDICRLDLPGEYDVVYNLACPASPTDFDPLSVEILMTCTLGTRNLLDVAVRTGARFCQASTSEVYGDPEVHPQPESYRGRVNPLGPRAIYDEGKRAAEALIMAYHRRHGLPTRIIRIFNTYGPRMRLNDGRALPNFITQALRGEPLTIMGDGSYTRCFTYVDDLIDGMIRVCGSGQTDPFNVGSQEEVTVAQVAREVVELTGSRSRLVFLPTRADDPKVRKPDITRARAILGWEPRTARREGFSRTIEDFRRRLGIT